MPLRFNVFTGKLDYIEDSNKYVKISGDTMTGDLYLPILHATNANPSIFDGGVTIKSGKKLIFDGA